MRIVAGRHRGRRLAAPSDDSVRPTADRTREALFGILAGGRLSAGHNPLIDARVLDAFAGTGALGLEALSRGARQAVFFDKKATARRLCRDNLATLGEAAHGEILAADSLAPPAAEAPADLVFLDPPYDRGLAPQALAALTGAGWIAGGSLIVVELMATEAWQAPTGYETLDDRTYGKARLIFLRPDAEVAPPG